MRYEIKIDPDCMIEGLTGKSFNQGRTLIIIKKVK
jgi:hypothetical protein